MSAPGRLQPVDTGAVVDFVADAVLLLLCPPPHAASSKALAMATQSMVGRLCALVMSFSIFESCTVEGLARRVRPIHERVHQDGDSPLTRRLANVFRNGDD